MLTGTWTCDDGGTYYIRQVDNNVYWFAEGSNGGWANVAHGAVGADRLIVLTWADVPKGSNNLSGVLVLKVVDSKNLEIVDETGGYGGTKWSRP